MATVGQPGPGAMRRVTVHYANSPTGNTGEANLEGLDDHFLQFVLGQEGLHQSILDEGYSNQNHMRGPGPTPSDHSQAQYYHGESSTATAAATASRTSGRDEQIASDLEYAKQLQEMEDLAIEDDDISCVPSPSDTDDDHDHNEEEADRQDDNDDPDNMTYEQRQALVESVGTEGRGLSDELISYLQSWKYKSSGFFSRKTNHEDCPICLNTFRHRESLITLPCKHNYHAVCVAKWLKIEKTCPVCKYEVFGPS
ncbi:E3 ubiquitin ligase BIG BROTHER-related-like [Phragmites australis]|uniref:E3 ubiquitin ligase BIG BROTHER-related-like n=1 Tax=Phragmites australis TaxID=29695 RepID=UPI002D797A76|nr:E3 ubiquitin ligase BIG BROTHER-related-like [Phragmites australis]